MGRILALDIGMRRSGIAISDISRQVISPRPSMFIENLKKPWGLSFFEHLKKELSEFWAEIDEIVIGDADALFRSSEENIQNRNKNSEISRLVDQVSRVLNSNIDLQPKIKVSIVSEACSTMESCEILKNLGFSKSRIRKNKDSYAALLLLKDYLTGVGKEVIVSF